MLSSLLELGAAEALSGLRRKSNVESLNTIVHGELWEKNVLLCEEEEDRYRSTGHSYRGMGGG